MTKQQAAAEFVSFYRWCLYHDIALHSDVMVLGWMCPLDVVRSENEAMIINRMEKL
jgi:hypothetical protein